MSELDSAIDSQPALFAVFALLCRRMAPIHDAARNKNADEISSLVTQDPTQLDALDGDRRTPLILACESGHVESVEWLLARGASVNVADSRGATALYMACLRGHVKVVHLLLGKGADATARAEKGWTCLMAATAYSQIMRALLANKEVDVNARDEWGCTALWWACYRGHAESARLLLLDRQVR